MQGGIGSALESIQTIITPETAEQEHVHTMLKELLRRHQALTTHEAVQSFNPLTGFYDISALNTDVNSGQLLTALKGFVNRTGRKEGGNMNLLFWGLPGTGKTEFAKYLAHETGMDLIVKRASDMLSCYVGETEKSIRAAFDEAKRQGAILMIDEADSFLSTRDMAVRSWEITQVNELLTQMENHTGVLICCTNLLQTLDNASLRRFNWKIEFKPLTEQGKLLLYRRYFCIEGRFPADAQERRIMAIPHLTAGDMKAVWLKTRFMEQDLLNHEGLISMLENEVRYKEKATGERVGF
jgi:transitional endoplasmic reticulum ATPase